MAQCYLVGSISLSLMKNEDGLTQRIADADAAMEMQVFGVLIRTEISQLLLS